MDIRLNNVSKRFRFEWVLKNVHVEFKSGTSYALLGPNGSGKSTFLRLLSGQLTPTKGQVSFSRQGKKIDIGEVYKQLSFSGPYIELLEEMTLEEAIRFHSQFKPFKKNLQPPEVLEYTRLLSSRQKEIRHFSSGMKQRLKLALALCSDTPTVFLDEPTTNLDRQGVAWYKQLVQEFKDDRLIVVASNVEEDYDFCEIPIEITQWK